MNIFKTSIIALALISALPAHSSQKLTMPGFSSQDEAPLHQTEPNNTTKNHLAFSGLPLSHDVSYSILFSAGSSQIDADQIQALHNKIAELGVGRFLVLGFADRSGTLEANVQVSRDRALEIASRIAALSPKSEVQIVSSPIWKGEFSEGRRVEILFSPL